MTDDEQRQEVRDLIRFFGATVEEVAAALEIDVERAAALCAEVVSPGEPADRARASSQQRVRRLHAPS